MNYLLKNSRREKMNSVQMWVTCAVLVVAGIFYFFAPAFVNNTLYSFARPIWNAKNYVSETIMASYSLISDKERLVARNNALEQKLEEANIVIQSLNAYKKENENLKAILGRDVGEKRILASVMAKPNHSIYDTLLLDVGEQLGVTVGDQVLAGDFALGSIREVYANHSKATLLSSPGEVLPVLIGDSNIQGDALGRGAGNFIVKIPKEISIVTGDLIRLPGINPKFLGTVLDIEQTVTSTFQSIFFHLPVNINNLRWVEIVKSK